MPPRPISTTQSRAVLIGSLPWHSRSGTAPREGFPRGSLPDESYLKASPFCSEIVTGGPLRFLTFELMFPALGSTGAS